MSELRSVIEELKAAMFLTGARTVKDLAARTAIVTRPTADWLEAAK